MTTAVITASYAADFARCQLLCESMDRHLLGDWHHYILVQAADYQKFLALKTANRTIVSERDLFPSWLRAFPDPISKRHRWVWLSPFSKPLRGWHAQQLRRLSIAQHISEPILLSIDSDVIMVRDFDVARLENDGHVRFYKKSFGLKDEINTQIKINQSWSRSAGHLLGLPTEQNQYHDYIHTFVAWRRQTVCDLLSHIEQVHGQSWIKQCVKQGAFSECLMYGRYVDDIIGGQYHLATDQPLCHVVWFQEDLINQSHNTNPLAALFERMEPSEVAIGIQSFIQLDMDDLRSQLSADNVMRLSNQPAKSIRA